MLREFAGAAKATALSGTLSAAATAINVVDGTGYPTGGTGPFVVTLDTGLASEEKVLVATRTGNTLTVATSGRGYDGTTASDHTNAASVVHTISAVDLREANAHVNDTTGDPHPQYLTPAEGAILYAPAGAVSTSGGSTITTSAAGVKGLTVKGAASQTANLAEFQNSAGAVLASLSASGSISLPTVTVTNATANIGGNPHVSAGSVSVGALAPFAASARMQVNPGDAAHKGLVVRGAVAQTANLAEFQDSAGVVLASVGADGQLTAVLAGVGAKTFQVGAVDSAGPGFRTIRVSN